MTRDLKLNVGQSVAFSKTVGEADVYGFAGITGDFTFNHVNEDMMSRSKYGQRIAHGALLVGYMSTAAAKMLETTQSSGSESTAISLGYDGIRFLAPVFFGDTVTVQYTIVSIDADRSRALADMIVTNQRSETVAVGKHHLKWVSA